MKKLFLIFIASFLVLGFSACSSDEDEVTEYSYDELPAWLIPQAKEVAESFNNVEGDLALFYSISRATGIHGETVYHIYRIYDSCVWCNLYDKNGNQVSYADVFGEKTTIGDEGWVIVFPKKR